MSGDNRTEDTLTVGAALAAARRKLDAVDARVLMCHVLARDAGYLIAHDADPLDAAQCAAFAGLVARRAAGEPVAYLTGEREFHGRPFRVTPDVLVPRPETELLVDWALEVLPADRPARVLDLGTGSGCVALSIALARPRASVVAVDRSAAALAVATENARRLGAANVTLRESDWFRAVGGESFDVIVSNPPYVAAGDPHLARGDLRYEPALALAAGADGLDAIRIIVAEAARHLNPGGWLALEHGHDQAARCRALLGAAGLQHIASRRDLAGIERIACGKLDLQHPR